MFLLLSSLKLGSSFIFEKFGIEFRTSFLNKSKFDKFSLALSFLIIKLKIFQSSSASPIGYEAFLHS